MGDTKTLPDAPKMEAPLKKGGLLKNGASAWGLRCWAKRCAFAATPAQNCRRRCDNPLLKGRKLLHFSGHHCRMAPPPLCATLLTDQCGCLAGSDGLHTDRTAHTHSHTPT
eukprot:NODE_2090_length_836_cov_202.242694_g1470_i0.p2 GENE.NODE_2090_length_836_cov_202.242694_g1470_i0~~NODE_2090_length_836_cov_202.242694_g1470_i0.p2  ORF type:complete len:111 (+),score=3.93 NODE_2090_length_836_cov_202.242694_g1470_i0:176-508(+)